MEKINFKGGALTLSRIQSVDELRSIAHDWDQLWLKSEVCLPRSRATLLAQWLEFFSYANNFKAVMVEQSGRMVAALPLIIKPFKGFLTIGSLATSHAVHGGDFLLDPDCDIPAVIDLMISDLARSSFSFISFEGVAYMETRWQELLKGMSRARILAHVAEEYMVGRVFINGDWSSYEKKLSKKHRYNRRREARMLANEGETRFVVLSEFSTTQVEPYLLLGFEVENRSWKGARGTSVLKTPGLSDFLSKEASFLAKQGQIKLAFLEHKGEPIAFIYVWYSKGTHFTAKVGYDQDYKKFGPGQQLMMHFIRYLHELPQPQVLDFCGPLAPWSEGWSTETYPMGRIFCSTDHFTSRLYFKLNFNLKPRLLNFLKPLRFKRTPTRKEHQKPSSPH